MDQTQSRMAPAEQRLFHWTGRLFYFATLAGLAAFGTYIILRATGFTSRNFYQWRDLATGLPMQSAADWIASIGIGMHFFMGAVLVLAWPILFSNRIRARHRAVHRWTGRVYVTAGLLAGIGGLSFIIAHHDGGPSHVAFAIWGSHLLATRRMEHASLREMLVPLIPAAVIAMGLVVVQPDLGQTVSMSIIGMRDGMP